MAESSTLYEGHLAILGSPAEWEEVKQVWLFRRDYSGFGATVQSFAKCRVGAGAIAMRTLGKPEKAFQHWRSVSQLKEGLLEAAAACAAHQSEHAQLPITEFVAADFLYVQYGLLLAGMRSALADVRNLYDLPFVRMGGDGEPGPNVLALEARIMFAAWEGDQTTVEEFAALLERHYARFKLSKVYAGLWRAVAQRDGAALDRHLPEAEEAYRKSARCKRDDPWGGEKALNAEMFDVYTTCVLKIARACGLTWMYGNDFTRQIWPAVVLDHWDE